MFHGNGHNSAHILSLRSRQLTRRFAQPLRVVLGYRQIQDCSAPETAFFTLRDIKLYTELFEIKQQSSSSTPP